ncbi:MAG TPA: glycosyltransferase WbuB [Aeromonadales bacterium]|nr:glycosyltransferase WbuB [Aeromonadales bacterium]
MTKRILIVTEYFYPEEFKINEIADSWLKKGYIIDVLTQQPTYPLGKIFSGYSNKWFVKESYFGINIYRVKAVTGYRESLFRKLLKYFTFMILGSVISLKIGRKYDYIFGFDVGPLTGMVPAVLLKKFYNKKVTLWVQDVWPDSVYAYGFKKNKVLEFLLNWFVRFVYKNTSNIAVSGKGFIDRIRPYFDADKKIAYLPNWADELNKDLTDFRFSREQKIHFTFAGNIGTVQNLDKVIKAFAALPRQYQEKAQLNLVGDGSYVPILRDWVAENKLENVIFWGRQPRDEMYRYFNASDFLIVSLINKPIFSLTVPAKVQTYIAAKKPILAVISGDAADLVKDNKLGFAVEPDDINAITTAFKQCIDADKQLLAQFSQNCEQLTDITFNKERIINSLLNLLTT